MEDDSDLVPQELSEVHEEEPSEESSGESSDNVLDMVLDSFWLGLEFWSVLASLSEVLSHRITVLTSLSLSY